MSEMTRKLRILAIHGYQQSDKTFKAKIGSLRSRFKKEVDFVFIKAPHRVPPIEINNETSNDTNEIVQSDEEQLGWWVKIPTNEPVGFDESVKLIEQTFKEQGPFDGILGFSQGGAFVSILCSMQQKKLIPIDFKFAIIVAGFKSICTNHEIYYDEKFLIPSLHVYGENDKVISSQRSEDLSNMFENKRVMTHEGGHYVPGKKHLFNDFIMEMLEKKKCEDKAKEI